MGFEWCQEEKATAGILTMISHACAGCFHGARRSTSKKKKKKEKKNQKSIAESDNMNIHTLSLSFSLTYIPICIHLYN